MPHEAPELPDLDPVAAINEVPASSFICQAPPPTFPAEPTKLENEDLLKYQLLGSRVQNADLKITMYQRELQYAQIERAKEAHGLSQFHKSIADKYKFDLHAVQITEDGYIVPRTTPLRGG